MEERVEIKKSHDPEKLIVFKAGSLEDEIRFWFNDYQYVSARDNYDGTFSIFYEEEKVECNNEPEKELGIIKKNIKKYLSFIFSDKIKSLFIFIYFIFLLAIIKNALIDLLLANFIFFLIFIFNKVDVVYKNTPISLKSKHSAEHMMINFLEEKKRLPQNMSEIKSTSRFRDDCGSRQETIGCTEDFVQSAFTSVIAINIGNCIIHNCKNGIISCIILIVVYIIIGFIIGILMKKYNKLNFIIKPIQKLLNNILQCCNTTRKIEDNDIILAYYAAKEWMKIVYPEFYNKDDDTFYESEES